MHFSRLSLRIIVICVCATLSSCMLGPDFRSPTPPQTKHYTKSPLAPKTVQIKKAGKAGKSQYFIDGQQIPIAWWTLFRSSTLDELIRVGFSNSPTLAAAKATLTQAKENWNAQVGLLLLPAVSANISGERERFSGSSLGSNSSSIFNLYNASVNVGYTLDFFGASRRQVEAFGAQVDFEYYELLASYLTLSTNIATTAITEAALSSQIKATEDLIQAERDQLTILKKQFQLGGISKLEVLSQETFYNQTRALLPPLKKNLAQTHHALAVLVGSLPSEAELPRLDLDTLYLPEKLPLSLPSNLVKQRPDIQASEALLHQASAEVGVATANLFPQISINGMYGWESLVPSQLFHSVNKVWSYGSQLAAPLFRGGALQAQRRAAIAAFESSLAQYRQTVLVAFQNVADSLRAIEFDARELKEQKNAEIAAYESLRLTRSQFRLGAVNYLSLLIAEQQYQQSLINRIQAQAARYTDTVALFQALGGGWIKERC